MKFSWWFLPTASGLLTTDGDRWNWKGKDKRETYDPELIRLEEKAKARKEAKAKAKAEAKAKSKVKDSNKE